MRLFGDPCYKRVNHNNGYLFAASGYLHRGQQILHSNLGFDAALKSGGLAAGIPSRSQGFHATARVGGQWTFKDILMMPADCSVAIATLWACPVCLGRCIYMHVSR